MQERVVCPQGWLRVAGVLVGLSWSTTAFAQEVTADQMNREMDVEQQRQELQNSFGGAITFGRIDEDFFVSLQLRLSFDYDYWGVGLQAPLRFRVIDNDPQDDNDIGSVIRKEDWDQVSDILRFIRYVYVGQKDERGPFYVRLGELNGTSIGHGTIMHRYWNNIDVSRWRAGLKARVDIAGVGAELVVSDLLDWHVVGGRVFVRPFQLALGKGWWDKVVLGVSVVADTKAPLTLETRFTGTATVVQVDNRDEPIVTESRPFLVGGVDLGIELLATDWLSITPYTDINRMTFVDHGWGWHLGVLWGVNIPLGFDSFVVDLRTEYRLVSGDYVAPYFNTLYEIERYNVLNNDSPEPLTRLQCLERIDAGCNTNTFAIKNGYFFEGRVGFPKYATLGGEYLDYSGGQDDGQFRVYLDVPALDYVRFTAFYYRINIEGPSDLFALDNKSGVIAQIMIPIYLFNLQARWWRIWRADEQDGGYASVDDWSVGVGFSYSF